MPHKINILVLNKKYIIKLLPIVFEIREKIFRYWILIKYYE